MNKIKDKISKVFIHQSLAYLLYYMLGLVLILVFYLILDYDSIYLRENFISLRVNDGYKYDLIKNSKDKDLGWYTLNPAVAEVDEKGNISARNIGETELIIKSRFGLFSKKVDIRVSNFNVYSIVFEEDSISLKMQDKRKLIPILNGDANIKTNLEWKSSDPEVVSVDEMGNVVALKDGYATITAEDKYTEITGSIIVNVDTNKSRDELAFAVDATDAMEEISFDVEKITLNTNRLDMYVGDTKKISSVVYPSNATNKTILYKSSDTSIASVNASGYVTAKKKGICNIFVTNEDSSVSVTMVIKVSGKKINVSKLDFKEKEIKLEKGETYLLNPIISPKDASDKRVTYSSSNTSVASVDENGKIKALKQGLTTIVAISTDGKLTSKIVVEVANKKISKHHVGSVSTTGYENVMIVGDTTKIISEVKDKNGNSLPVNITTSDSDVLYINNGVVTALKSGAAYIELESTDGSYHELKNVIVLPGKIDTEFVYLNKKSLQLVIGDSDNLIATVMPENANNKEIEWSSSNPSIASVSVTGDVVAHSQGTAIITAKVKDTGIKNSLKVAVVAKQNMIDIRNQKLTGYLTGFRIYDKGTTVWRAMQNFAIANIGKANETIYVSYPSISNMPSKTKLTGELKKEMTRTVIVKIPKKYIKSPGSNQRKYMFLNYSGHGQSFDLDLNPSYIWANSTGFVSRDVKGTLWGNNKSSALIKFKANKITDKYTSVRKMFVDSNASYKNNPDIAFNFDENLVAVRSGRVVYIYNAREYRKGKKKLLYSFTLNSKSVDGTSYNFQGGDLESGYYYQYRGFSGTKFYVEVYNYAGELQYTKIFTANKATQESEGLQIYNHHIFVGVTNKCSGCSGRVNNIYYFK